MQLETNHSRAGKKKKGRLIGFEAAFCWMTRLLQIAPVKAISLESS
jgi:hypothetical protein